jgi:hypothetical protein
MKFRTRFFKFISAILVVSLFLVSSINVFAAENTDIVEDNIKTTNKEHYDVGDIKFDVEYTQDGENHKATIYKNGGKTIDTVCWNDKTNTLTYNGKPIVCETIFLETLPSTRSNWGSPTTEVTSLSLASYGIEAAIVFLHLKFGVPSDKATTIATLILNGTGMLYVKTVTRYNYVDYAPKVGFKITESLHTTPSASDTSLFTRSWSGSR